MQQLLDIKLQPFPLPVTDIILEPQEGHHFELEISLTFSVRSHSTVSSCAARLSFFFLSDYGLGLVHGNSRTLFVTPHLPPFQLHTRRHKQSLSTCYLEADGAAAPSRGDGHGACSATFFFFSLSSSAPPDTAVGPPNSMSHTCSSRFCPPFPFCQTTFYPYRSVCSSEYSARLQKQCLRLTPAPAEQFNFTLLFENLRLILHWRLHFCDSQCCILPCSSVVNPFTTAFTVVFTEQSKWSYKRCSLMSLSPAICAMTSLAALLAASSIISLVTSSSFLF